MIRAFLIRLKYLLPQIDQSVQFIYENGGINAWVHEWMNRCRKKYRTPQFSPRTNFVNKFYVKKIRVTRQIIKIYKCSNGTKIWNAVESISISKSRIYIYGCVFATNVLSNLSLDLIIVYSFIQLYELCCTIFPVTNQCVHAVIRIYLNLTNNIFPLFVKNNVIVLIKWRDPKYP